MISDCFLGSFPNDCELLYLCFLFLQTGLVCSTGFLTTDLVFAGDFIIVFWRWYRGWGFSYAITEELHAPVFTPE